ncbi:hypothetical protein L1987_23972 [Smallanthus sonchifolius]|uniref:Uncharacterized protein n=1 Tax=Smallanthus sonchifolius TaxID=185202 RepID=A0ACB9IKL4_9ASTR|nr:hypothetical protein L1987_23972 [Smallanthus sonchifolius]
MGLGYRGVQRFMSRLLKCAAISWGFCMIMLDIVYKLHATFSISHLEKNVLNPRELFLGGHGLSVVPPQLWEISDITKVDLSRNSIEDLPIQLSSCASLETLILSRNKIKEWPSAILESLKIPSDGFHDASVDGYTKTHDYARHCSSSILIFETEPKLTGQL